MRCGVVRNCRAAQDPTAPLAEQAAAIASRSDNVFVNPYIEDASFVKLRELSVTWSVPSRWSNALASAGAAITLAGRNLATLTRYKGLDPELDYSALDELSRQDMAKTPLLREIVLRLELGGGTRH
jgi:TonB-dependent starch-binding outer membrane protein SusC